MTDRIDLDELDVESDDEPAANRGDWFWRGDGDRDSEPDANWLERHSTDADSDADAETDSGGTADVAADSGTDAARSGTEEETAEGDGESSTDRDPLPGVPGAGGDGPAGIPIEGGGTGAGSAPAGAGVDGVAPASDDAGGAEAGTDAGGDVDGPTPRPTGDDADEVWDDPSDAPEGTQTGSVASGPHGGGVDDMTMALTYEAAKRLADPRFAVIEAKTWTDWIGIVGDVPAYVINKFQREHELDVDFFSDANTGPAQRLRDIDEHSMFFSERMVVVGVEGDAEVAEQADWEFVPLEEAAEKADWELDESPE